MAKRDQHAPVSPELIVGTKAVKIYMGLPFAEGTLFVVVSKGNQQENRPLNKRHTHLGQNSQPSPSGFAYNQKGLGAHWSEARAG